MANQLALRAHTRHGDEVILHKRAHIFNYESGAPAALAGVMIRFVDSEDGTLPFGDVRASIRQIDDPHFAQTTLIAFENTHNGCGGCVVDPENVAAVAALARERGIALHLDGARLFNAAVASGRSAAELAAPFDTVSFCLSKGLGAPVGSLLVGDRRSIRLAYRYRKMYGGGMRQAGFLAAAGLYALRHHVERMADDHQRAQRLAGALSSFDAIRVDGVETNIVYFELPGDHPGVAVGDSGAPRLIEDLKNQDVWMTGGGQRFRWVTHLDVNDAQIEAAIRALKQVMTRY